MVHTSARQESRNATELLWDWDWGGGHWWGVGGYKGHGTAEFSCSRASAFFMRETGEDGGGSWVKCNEYEDDVLAK